MQLKKTGTQGSAIGPPKPGGMPSTYPDFACSSQEDIPRPCRLQQRITLGCRPKAFWAGQLQASQDSRQKVVEKSGQATRKNPNHHTSSSLDSTIRCSALFNMIPPVSLIVFQVTGRGGVFVPIGLVVACAEGTFLVLYTQNEVHAHRPRGDKPMSFKLVSESMHNLVCQKSLFWTVAK